MDRNEMLIVLTVIELLDQSKSIPEIERAYEKARKKLDRPNHPPKEAKLTYAIRRDETE